MSSRGTVRHRILPIPALAVALAAAGVLAPAAAQDGLDGLCTPGVALTEECYLAAASVRGIQQRIGVALWGGSPMPGSASTLGMRLGSFPRMSFSARVLLVPTTLPPLTDRSTDESRTAWVTALSAQGTVGLFSGFSPMPTVGGVLSLDATARASWAPLPSDKGFDGGVWGWMVGVRLGALRESFTLPGISVAGSYGHSSEVTFGDPEAATTDGFWQGSVSDLKGTLAATKRIGPVGLTGGVAWDRYGSDVRVGYRATPAAPQTVTETDAVTERWSAFVDASWTLLVFHGILEAGWQETPEPEGLPTGVDGDAAGWWAGLSFRLSI